MSDWIISFIFAAGSGTWVFNKMQNRSGRNTQQSLLIASISGAILFIIFFVVLSYIGSLLSNG